MYMKLLAIYLLFFLNCASKEHSNFNVINFKGIEINSGKQVNFSEIKDKEDIIINIYAPNCPPCLQELETLEYLYDKIKKNSNIAFFMAVDPKTALDRVGIDIINLSSELLLEKATNLMKQEIEKYNISLPVVIMQEPFSIGQNNSLVMGMPETLLFKTNPFNLYYNFIGPIGVETELQKIKEEHKVIFFENMLGIKEL